MVDRSYRGPADRISPEAPVPVVHVTEQSFAPGGAGNVACNLAVLGARPLIVSVCGEDAAGDEIQADLSRRGLSTSGLIVDPNRPTVTKTRVFAGHQQVARFDFEKRAELSADQRDEFLERLKRFLPAHRAVVISDYGKGCVTPAVIRLALTEARRRRLPVIVDPKIEHFLQYRGVDCITPNTKEAVEGMRALPPKTEADLTALGQRILRRLGCSALLITRGEKGMTIFQKGRAPETIPTQAREVYDVTGAGDTVVAAFSLGRAVGAPHADAARIANAAAGVVVGKVGTACVTRDELVAAIRNRR